MAVSIRNVRERLTAGSLPQLPKSLPSRTTSANQRRRCASVPSAAMNRSTVECMCNVMAVLAQPAAIVRIIAMYVGMSSPSPPCARGTAAASRPSRQRSRQLSTGFTASRS
jgi:hypothetical protein